MLIRSRRYYSTFGATEIPNDTIEEICGNFISSLTIKDLIPGLLFSDTEPSHAAFTSLRKRGGALPGFTRIDSSKYQ